MEEKAEGITPEENTIAQLASGGQNRTSYLGKLYYKNGKLFAIDNKGKIIKKYKHRLLSKKKYPSYYKRKRNQLVSNLYNDNQAVPLHVEGMRPRYASLLEPLLTIKQKEI